VSTITTDQGIVHYQVFGRGRPAILLHGWLGSWGLWQETMRYLSKDYRTYAMDFWGFGESGKKRETYNISDFVSLVDQFMEQLGIARAPVIGHSMGGTVSMAFAIQYPHRVTKVGVIGSPIKGNSLAILLKLAGYPLNARVVFSSLWALKLGIRIAAPMITRDKRWPDMISADLSRTTLESFLLSIKSLRKTDLVDELKDIQVPILGMFGAKDNIVNPGQRDVLRRAALHPSIAYFENAGHFIMLDEPESFMKTLKTFLDEDIPASIKNPQS